MKKFDSSAFLNTSVDNSPFYTWVWNGPLSKEETDRQLDEMHKLGIRRFYIVSEPKLFRPTRIPTDLEPDYLTDGYMAEYRYAMEKAKSLGMKCWLYDEGGWPSGGACGKVLKEHPEYARRTLTCSETAFKANEKYKKSTPQIVAAFINGDVLIEEGYVFEADMTVDEYYSAPHLFEQVGIPDFPDITRAEATDYFIEITHEKYKEAMGDMFGDNITAVFTDEPTQPRPFSFRKEMVELYEKTYGRSIIPALPALYGKVKPTEKTAEMRMEWFDMCSRLFCENFLIRCKNWTNNNGMDFTGHMDIDHVVKGTMLGGNFHLMRSLRLFDIPGIDVICRHIFPHKRGEFFEELNSFYPRYASSAAYQTGAKSVMTESLGVYGNGLTFEQMRFIFGFQAVRGINEFNQFGLSYSNAEYHLPAETPHYTVENACYSDLTEWNKYQERLAYTCSVGTRICNTALYYPARDLWAGTDAENVANDYEVLGRRMEDKCIDFDILDDDVLEGATGLEEGVIRFGNACYSTVVFPKCQYLSEKSRKNLEIFEKNGGKVLYGDADLKAPSEIIGNAFGLQMMKRTADDQTLYILFNEDTECNEFTFDFGRTDGYYIDITEGVFKPLQIENRHVTVKLEGGETGVICFGGNIPKLTEGLKQGKEIKLTDFTFRRLTSLDLTKSGNKMVTINEDSVPVKLGDWSYITGKDFSGSAMYETEFELSEDECGDAVLDLGVVKYTCEVIINGKSLGKKIMPPYRYTIGKENLEKNNTLQIIVKNTAGNQYYYTDIFDKWPEWMLTPYRSMEKEYEVDTLESGLYGPVKVLF